MLTSNTVVTQMPLTMDPTNTHAGLGSLFAAAVVSRSFRELLLTNPERALQQGYMGKRFALNAEDTALITAINARTLPELAQQVVRTLGG
jgi:hypothetical protein